MRHCCATSCEPQAGEAAPPAILALPFMLFLMTLLTLDLWALKGMLFLFLGRVPSGSLAFAMMFFKTWATNLPHNRTRQAYLDALPCSGGCMASFLH